MRYMLYPELFFLNRALCPDQVTPEVDRPDSQVSLGFWVEQVLHSLAVDLHVAHLRWEGGHMILHSLSHDYTHII